MLFRSHEFLVKLSEETKVQITGVNTGMSGGINLGSGQFRPLQAQKVALVVGEGISSYDAGEIWHLFDQRYNMKITKLDTRNLNRANLANYTDIILPPLWGGLDENVVKKLDEWTKNGGTLIAYGRAINWLQRQKLVDIKLKSTNVPAKNISLDRKSVV